MAESGKKNTEFNCSIVCAEDGTNTYSFPLGLVSCTITEGKKQNPYVPERGWINEEKGEATFFWLENGEKVFIKVFCDDVDTFSWDSALAQAIKYKVFGSKTQYKKKWQNIISKKLEWIGDVHDAEFNEKARMEEVKQEQKAKEEKEKSKKLNAKTKELEALLGIVSKPAKAGKKK